ncbi:MAG: protein kinase, partial [Phycisphaerae bacterium]
MAQQPFDEKAVFLEALRLPEGERAAYLDRVCPDVGSRARIESLLQHRAMAGENFLGDTVEALQPPDDLKKIDEFEILHRLGQGGMGVVYLAHDTILNRKVALKVLHQSLGSSEHAIARFRAEARSAAALQHPAIVPVFTTGQSGSLQYLVSEYVEGETLAALIASRTAGTQGSTREVRDWYRKAAEIVAQLADALDCAHRAKIVHRDVKPSNVLMDPQIGPRLTDFGIAKHLVDETSQTQTGLVGSCHYMSPEQAAIATAGIDHRSDIFSLGVVLYELLAGRKPFDGENMPAVLRSVIEANPRKLRTFDKRIPVDLETICHKAMEKRPPDRYQTAAHVAADLRCYLSGDPILAKPPSLGRKLRRFGNRYKTILATAAIVLLIASPAAFQLSRSVQSYRRLARITVMSEIQKGQLFVRKLSDDGQVRGQAVRYGSFPATIRLAPGLYRLGVVAEGGRHADTTVVIPRERMEFAVQLNATADVRDEAMIFVRGGMHSLSGSKISPVAVEDFYIDRAEVSNAQYRDFLLRAGGPIPRHWELGVDPALYPDLPVVALSWDEANAYCRAQGKRLPSRTEWEYAMSRPDGRHLPWTNEAVQEPVSHVALYLQ